MPGGLPAANTIAGVVFNNGSVDTYGRHSRFCLPIIGFEQLADVPDDDWRERIPLVIVHTVFPSTVLIEHEQGGSMIRISPGRPQRVRGPVRRSHPQAPSTRRR